MWTVDLQAHRFALEIFYSRNALLSTNTARGAVIKQDGGRYKTWTLDSGLDYGLDYGLDWTVDSVLAIKQTMNARLPNEWRNGLTVGTGIYAAFSKTGWLLSLCFYSLLAQLVGKELRYKL